MKRSFAILSAVVLLAVTVMHPQAAPAAGGRISSPSVWNVALGGSYLGSDAGGSQLNLYGWNASVSEYPYASRRWLGGAIEVSGDYSRESRTESSNGIKDRIRVNRALYTYAGGPSVTASAGRMKPFAHALFGAVNSQTRGRLNGSALRQFDPPRAWPTHAGMLLGGGADIAVSDLVAIRVQADWVQVWTPGEAVNMIHATTGVVFRF